MPIQNINRPEERKKVSALEKVATAFGLINTVANVGDQFGLGDYLKVAKVKKL